MRAVVHGAPLLRVRVRFRSRQTAARAHRAVSCAGAVRPCVVGREALENTNRTPERPAQVIGVRGRTARIHDNRPVRAAIRRLACLPHKPQGHRMLTARDSHECRANSSRLPAGNVKERPSASEAVGCVINHRWSEVRVDLAAPQCDGQVETRGDERAATPLALAPVVRQVAPSQRTRAAVSPRRRPPRARRVRLGSSGSIPLSRELAAAMRRRRSPPRHATRAHSSAKRASSTRPDAASEVDDALDATARGYPSSAQAARQLGSWSAPGARAAASARSRASPARCRRGPTRDRRAR